MAILAEMAKRANNPVLRARLADVCWLLDRKRVALGSLAVIAYVEIVHKTDSGELNFQFENTGGALEYSACNYLRRAVQIGRAIGWERAETIAARDAVIMLRKRAIEKRALMPVIWFAELDFECGASDPVEVAAAIDEVLAVSSADTNSHAVVGLWRLAARAYHVSKRQDDKYRCQ
jgi:hypothetical protein